MKIACLYPENITSSWNCSTGVANELERQGHEVLRIPLLIDAHNPGKLPSFHLIEACDAVLLLGPEHYAKMLDAFYSWTRWNGLKIPKLAWFHEGAFRDDGQRITTDHLQWADELFFPALQDAEFFDQEHLARGRTHWMPFGVDTNVFGEWCYCDEEGCDECGITDKVKKYDAAFIGGLYPKRMEFLGDAARTFTDGQSIDCGNVVVQDLSGYKPHQTVELYARNLRQIRVFVNLPALSRLLVTKVFEVMACGTCLLTPTLEGEAHGNMKLFKNHVHCEYYSERNPAHMAKLARDLLADEPRRIAMGAAAAKEIEEKHSLTLRVKELLSYVSKEVANGSVATASA